MGVSSRGSATPLGVGCRESGWALRTATISNGPVEPSLAKLGIPCTVESDIFTASDPHSPLDVTVVICAADRAGAGGRNTDQRGPATRTDSTARLREWSE